MLRRARETVGQAIAPVARKVVPALLDSSLGDGVGAVRILKRFARQWFASLGWYEGEVGAASGAGAEAGSSSRGPAPIVPHGEQRPVLVYVSRRHSSCRTAKSVLDELGIDYQERDLTEDEGERRRLFEETGDRTFPQIYIDGRRLGGFDDLMVAREEGTLQELLYPTAH